MELYNVNKVRTETRANTIALAPDTDLFFNLIQNAIYRFSATFFIRSNLLSGFKFRHSGAANPVQVVIARTLARLESIDAERSFIDEAYSAADVILTAGTTTAVLKFSGLIENGPTAGTFRFLWAQSVANAATIAVLAGSAISFERLR